MAKTISVYCIVWGQCIVAMRTAATVALRSPVTGQELFLAISYSKPALVIGGENRQKPTVCTALCGGSANGRSSGVEISRNTMLDCTDSMCANQPSKPARHTAMASSLLAALSDVARRARRWLCATVAVVCS